MSELLSEFFDAYFFLRPDKMLCNVVNLPLGGDREKSFFKIGFPFLAPSAQPFLMVDDCPLESVDSSDDVTNKVFKGRYWGASLK